MCEKKKVVLVTGGNGGIGYHTALYLAEHGHHVIIGSRSRLDEAVGSIRASAAARNLAASAAGGTAGGATPTVTAFKLDLASLESVHSFAEQVKSNFKQLGGLVLNAGINNAKLAYSSDGVEATFATNHLGHFYLTQLLKPLLAPDARIIVTSSGTHDPANRAPWPAPHWSHPSELAMLRTADGQAHPAAAKYRAFGAYTNTKLCNVLFTYALSDKLQQQGSRVTAVAYNPGFVPSTSIFRGMPVWLNRFVSWLIPVMMRLLRGSVVTNTVEAAGSFQARLAVDPAFEGISGVYYQVDHQTRSSEASYDRHKADQLWQYSEELLEQLVPRDDKS